MLKRLYFKLSMYKTFFMQTKADVPTKKITVILRLLTPLRATLTLPCP